MRVSNEFRTPKPIASYRQAALVSCSGDVGRVSSFNGGAQHGCTDCAPLAFAASPSAQSFVSTALVLCRFLKPQCLLSRHASLQVGVSTGKGRSCQSARKTSCTVAIKLQASHLQGLSRSPQEAGKRGGCAHCHLCNNEAVQT